MVVVDVGLGRSMDDVRAIELVEGCGRDGKGILEGGGEDVRTLSLGPSLKRIDVAGTGVGNALGRGGLDGKIGRDWTTP